MENLCRVVALFIVISCICMILGEVGKQTAKENRRLELEQVKANNLEFQKIKGGTLHIMPNE